jgi:trehalose/maltose hydrolase-like predicted phosphorylase
MGDTDTWMIVNTSPQPHALAQFGAVCTVSNGYLGLNGFVAERPDGPAPLTLINGVFDEFDLFGLLTPTSTPRPHLDARYFDTAGPTPAIANLPTPLATRIFVGGRRIVLGRGQVAGFEQSLDLRCGVHRYRYEFKDGDGHATRVEMQRFADLRHAHRAWLRLRITPLNHAEPIRVDAGIDGDVRATLTRERVHAIGTLHAAPPERCLLAAHYPANNSQVRVGVQNCVVAGTLREPAMATLEQDAVYTTYVFDARADEAITIDRAIVLASSDDLVFGGMIHRETELDEAAAVGFDAALEGQTAAWAALWQASDVQLEGDDPAQLGLRFCIHHLLAAAPRFTDRLSLPARLLTGELYQGCVQYDTELYMLPLLTFTQPALARTCLNFRWRGLRAAREAAHQLGHDGGKLAWLAGPTGLECLGRWWRYPATSLHINGDVALALRQYLAATGDNAFLAQRGIDLLVEAARFYASRVQRRDDGTGDLPGVTGPDDGNCTVDTDFFTNTVAVETLRYAAERLAALAERDAPAHAAAVKRLGLRADEAAQWETIARRIVRPQHPETGAFEKCAGYFARAELPAELRAARMTQFVDVSAYRAANQPDVLLAQAWWPETVPPEARQANWDTYFERSLNYASLSFAAHGLAAADLDLRDEAYRQFILTTGIDLDAGLTGRHDTYLGLHGGALGGAWQVAVFGFGGVRLRDGVLHVTPRLPSAWQRLRFQLVLRGVTVRLDIDREQVTVETLIGPALSIPIQVGASRFKLSGGERRSVAYAASGS